MSHPLRALLAYRELVYNLAVRDLKLKYKRSAIGVAWSLLNPLLMMAIYTVIFGYFLNLVNTSGGRPYWMLVLAGLLPWMFFANAIGGSPAAFVHSANLIGRLYFPIEALPIAGVLANFVNFLISLGILIVVLLVLGLPFGAYLALLPVVLLAQLAFTIGLALLVATLTVYFRDLEHLIGIGLTALFYLTPVLYTLDPSHVPHGARRLIPFLQLNPLSWFLESYHSLLYRGTLPQPREFTLMMVASLLVLLLGYAVFLRMRARLPEEV